MVTSFSWQLSMTCSCFFPCRILKLFCMLKLYLFPFAFQLAIYSSCFLYFSFASVAAWPLAIPSFPFFFSLFYEENAWERLLSYVAPPSQCLNLLSALCHCSFMFLSVWHKLLYCLAEENLGPGTSLFLSSDICNVPCRGGGWE